MLRQGFEDRKNACETDETDGDAGRLRNQPAGIPALQMENFYS